MKYVEYCAGIGGTRAGLSVAGWQCILAIDHDPDAIAVHRLAHGSAVEGDVTCLSIDDLPQADAWVAGFPCQPFSSSGSRIGFGHRSGNVFEHLVRLMRERRPNVVILENVEGLLSNKSGHTFATILFKLAEIGYVVDWLVLDLRWFRVPQSRPRLFVVAALPGVVERKDLSEASGLLPGIGRRVPSLFATFLADRAISWAARSEGSLLSAQETLQPAIGKARPIGPNVFGTLGHAVGDGFVSYDICAPLIVPEAGSLSSIVAPDFAFPEMIRSVRYWSPKGGGGPAGLHVRDESLSHCVGTSLGGAPLFAVPLLSVSTRKDRDAFLAFSNWHREQNGLLVMRLRPDRAVCLFGPHTSQLREAVAQWDAGATRKFRLVGNMVAPVCAQHVATLVNAQLADFTALQQRERAYPEDGRLSSHREGAQRPNALSVGKTSLEPRQEDPRR
jgi:hypothetical protein